MGLSLFLCSWLGVAEKISVVTEYLPPYQVKNDDSSLGGISTEIVKALFKLTKDDFEIKVMPWARSYHQALTQKNTLIYSLSRTKERENLFYWVGDIYSEHIYIWALKSSKFKNINNIEQLKANSIGLVRQSYAQQYIENENFSNIYTLVNDDQSVQMLFAKRVDLIIGDALTLAPRVKKYHLDFDQMKPLVEIKPLSVDLYLAFNHNSEQALVNRYKKAFAQLKHVGRIAQILEELSSRYSVEVTR